MPSSVVPAGRSIARLRPKNQLTLPDAALTAVGATVGARFLVSVEDGAIRLDPVRGSYAGALKGLWPVGWMEELRRDRDSWQP
ncbi:MAG: hypothetical protein M3253_06035 [Chloroflexota bacterium]|nr:hypothetical protein [Chloroflexota bacterium]